MNRSRIFASFALGAVVATASLMGAANGSDYVVAGAVDRIADRCAAQFGAGFFDSGNGVCARVNNHVRVYVAPRSAGLSGWPSGGTSNAAVMSTDGSSIMPVAPTQRLRVRGNLDSYSPFR